MANAPAAPVAVQTSEHEHHHHHHHEHHVSALPTVLITGANSGIGLATAVAFAAAGWNTYATVRDLTRAEALVTASQSVASAKRLHVITMDVTSSQSIDEAIKYVFAREGRIDALINNAGIGIGGPVEATTDADVQRIFSTNVFSVIAASRSVIPYMRGRKQGTIINISSSLALWTWPMSTLYCSTKFAVDGFTSAFAKEVAQFGVRVVTVHPHATKSAFGANIVPGGRQFPSEIYEEIGKDFMTNLSAVLAAAAEPDTVAKACLEAALDKDMTRLRYYSDPKTEQRASEILKDHKKQLPTLF